MTDLIARLEEQRQRKAFPERRWMDLAVSTEDTDAILHALKVQQAAEEWRNMDVNERIARALAAALAECIAQALEAEKSPD